MHPILEKHRSLKAQLGDFEEIIAELATKINLPLTDYVIDHVALRTSSVEQAQQWLNSLSEFGKVLSDSIINQRPIYIIELFEGITLCGQQASIIELPFPRGKKEKVEGWEHIEIVSPYLPQETIEQWQNRIIKQINSELPNIFIEKDCPKAVGEELENPSISYKYSRENISNNKSNGIVNKIDSTSHGNYCCIKIHPHSLVEVISSTTI